MLYLPQTVQQDNKAVQFQQMIKGKVVHFRLQKEAASVPDFSTVTSVAVMPFVDDTTIMATQLDRGLDIPGGHVEKFDADATATAVREAREETGIDLALPLYLIGIIESDYHPKPTYMLITATKVAAQHTYTPQFEALGRELVSLKEFLRRYTAGSPEMMKELCKRAETVGRELFSTHLL